MKTKTRPTVRRRKGQRADGQHLTDSPPVPPAAVCADSESSLANNAYAQALAQAGGAAETGRRCMDFEMLCWMRDIVEKVAPGDGTRPADATLTDARNQLAAAYLEVRNACYAAITRGDLWVLAAIGAPVPKLGKGNRKTLALGFFRKSNGMKGKPDAVAQFRVWLWELCNNRLWHRHWNDGGGGLEILRAREGSEELKWQDWPSLKDVRAFVHERWEVPMMANKIKPSQLPKAFHNLFGLSKVFADKETIYEGVTKNGKEIRTSRTSYQRLIDKIGGHVQSGYEWLELWRDQVKLWTSQHDDRVPTPRYPEGREGLITTNSHSPGLMRTGSESPRLR